MAGETLVVEVSMAVAVGISEVQRLFACNVLTTVPYIN